MSSDPKEPTPLSAEQRERLESIHPMWSHQSGVRGHLPGEGCDVFPCLTNRALATIDAQAAEIAALKGALTKAIEDMQWMFGGWGITDEDQLANGRVVAHQNIEALRRVLAGKEDQGGD